MVLYKRLRLMHGYEVVGRRRQSWKSTARSSKSRFSSIPRVRGKIWTNA